MSTLDMNEGNRVKIKNAIQYASDEMNKPTLDNKDTMTGIKTIVAVERKVREAILLHEAEKDKIIDSHLGKNPIVTGPEIEAAVNQGLYREGLER